MNASTANEPSAFSWPLTRTLTWPAPTSVSPTTSWKRNLLQRVFADLGFHLLVAEIDFDVHAGAI
jgi:hypothetical protein